MLPGCTRLLQPSCIALVRPLAPMQVLRRSLADGKSIFVCPGGVQE